MCVRRGPWPSGLLLSYSGLPDFHLTRGGQGHRFRPFEYVLLAMRQLGLSHNVFHVRTCMVTCSGTRRWWFAHSPTCNDCCELVAWYVPGYDLCLDYMCGLLLSLPVCSTCGLKRGDPKDRGCVHAMHVSCATPRIKGDGSGSWPLLGMRRPLLSVMLLAVYTWFHVPGPL